MFSGEYDISSTSTKNETMEIKVNVRNVRVINHFNILKEFVGDEVVGYQRFPNAQLYSLAEEDGEEYSPILSSVHDDYIVNVLNRNLDNDSYAVAETDTYSLYTETSKAFTDHVSVDENMLHHVSGTFHDGNNEIDPNTGGTRSSLMDWIDNGVNWLKNRAKDYLKEQIDRGYINNIPGVNVSPQDILSTLGSKDIVSVIALAKKAFDRDFNLKDQQNRSSDIMFKNVLHNIASQKPQTIDDKQIIDAAKQIIGDENMM